MSPTPTVSSVSNAGTKSNTVNFFINGNPHRVDTVRENLDAKYKLVDYIRDNAGLKGTKTMCREGGCGACVVSVRSPGQNTERSVNSCLTPIFSCDGWSITTVEGLGNQKDGYHPVQKQLVNFGGTQCGFCSSGMVMNMYSLLDSKKNVDSKEVENSFDGNICRCTGYRPILDAFKSLSCDASDELKKKCADIEDWGTCPMKKAGARRGAHVKGCCTSTPSDIQLNLISGETWVKATTLQKAFEALDSFKLAGVPTRIVAGNTSTGVYKTDTDGCRGFVDIVSIPELSLINSETGNLTLGGAVTLAIAIETFKNASTIEGFEYTQGLGEHIGRIANVPVRNLGTLAGNLMLKHAHRKFPSDLFTLFETVGAQLLIASSPTVLNLHTLTEFLSLNMDKQIIVSIHFRPYTKQHIFRSFKITRRYQNSHAYVNAGFLMKIDTADNHKVLERPRIVFGGINDQFSHANETEAFFTGKSLKDANVLKDAAAKLNGEVEPEVNPVESSLEYRKLLTQTLLYKCVLGIVGTLTKSEFQLGGKNIERNVSSGKQTYETNETMWPIHKPVLKLESIPQVSGTAEYINDIPIRPDELFGAFVVSKVSKGNILSFDPTEALAIAGVVRFIKACDIPGENNYMIGADTPDEIFAEDKVQYAGQPVGLVLAKSKELAFLAAKKVNVEYGSIEKAILTIQDGIRAAQKVGSYQKLFGNAVKSVDGKDLRVPDKQRFFLQNSTAKFFFRDFCLIDYLESKFCCVNSVSNESPKHIITGEFEMGSQYHFQMENQICLCVPREDGMDVIAATQGMDHVQNAVSCALKMPHNEINIQVRRLGGAYGSKITRASHVASACAVAAYVTNKPVRVALDLQTNMEVIGKRPPYLMKYEVGVNDQGKILSLKGQIFCAVGISTNEEVALDGMDFLQSTYRSVGWEISPANIITNTAPNTWCRGPGRVNGVALVENLMEHISFVLKKDPVEVRMANMLTEGDQYLPVFGPSRAMVGTNLIPRMIEEMKSSGEVESRKEFINNFNKLNRWRKRGMAIVPMRFGMDFFGTKYPVYVAIYKNDGTVAVSHGGIEIGQGINTKIAQTVAFELGIPIEKIKVKPSNNLISPNTDPTGGSITSELACFGAQMACKKLMKRMAPVKETENPKSWEDLVTLCNKKHICLSESYMPSPNDGIKPYNIWVVNLTEVEIDVLTGEYKIVRVDVIEDAGKSLNPALDIGQVEGALVMGIGHWTTEKLIYDKETGQLLTNGTWLYKPPLSKDIPEDMRITLLKDAPNPYGVLRSKATGEPPQCSAVCVLFALRNAIYAARRDAGHDEWFQLDGPVTPEDILLKCLTTPSQFLL